jgi:hypothetical protein
MNDLGATDVGARRSKNGGPFDRLLAPLSSVWFGVAVLVVLFVYCSIGSAVPPFRRHALLDMTEFEWFHWWPFDVLIAILCLTLTVITVRRIPLRLVNAGVWMIHGGVIVLCLGSYLYFSTKVEGDAPVFRRRVEIRAPGMTEPVHVVAVPGAQAVANVGPDRWRFRVQSTNTDWPILTEGFEGQKAYAVSVMVERPGEEPFVRQVLAGYPQFSEDVIPGQGRAIKTLGRKLVAEDLEMTLGYEPTEYFHVMDSWALYVRRVGETKWIERPIKGMPRYNERIGDRSLVAGGSNLPLRPLDLVIPSSGEDDPLGAAAVRVTGYLPYAMMQQNWRDGGSQFNPMLRITIHAPEGAHQSAELFALDPSRSAIESGFVAFTWLPDAEALDRLPKSVGATLHVFVPESEKALAVTLDEKTVVGAEGEFTRIEGTEFAYRVTAVQDNLAIGERSVSVAIVDVMSPEGPFTRWAFDDERLNRDHRAGDAHGAGGGDAGEPDARIRMRYEPAIAPVLFAAVGDAPPALFVSMAGENERTIEPIAVGGQISLGRGFSVSADSLLLRASAEIKPFVVAPENRDRDVRAGMSMIRLEIASGSDVQRKWMRYNHYAFDDPQYTASGRFSYQPETIHVPGGGRVELMFSRERRKLPNPIALEDFRLKTHIGGYTGRVDTVLNYVSHLRFLADGGWSEPVPIEVNSPTEFGGLWYFQSTWDPPRPGSPGSGMNHTGLGIGNRRGVYVQLAGCCISVAGMIFAFYVKPVIRRRRAMRSMARVGAGREEAPNESAEREVASVV